MSTATIIKNLILPLVIKSAQVDVSSATNAYWEQFASDFINYETDATSIYNSLYKLKLNNPEDIFNQLPEVYSNFIKEIAVEYVLGNENELIDKLLESKNEFFLKEVSFLKTMKAVIIKTGRQQLKKDLPQVYDRLVFELDEEILRQVAKKKSREDLRNKFKKWDEEFVEEESNLEALQYSFARKSNNSFNNEESKYSSNFKRKVITLSWIKYAAAACIVLTAGIMYFKFNTENNFVQPNDNNVVTAPVKEETITPEIPLEALNEVVIVTKNAPVIESGLGFASKKNSIKITENNQKSRMASIVTAIEKYRQLLENEFAENKVDVSSRIKVLESKINLLQNELALLKEREKQYVFDGKALVLYVSNNIKEDTIVLYEDTYYLKKDADYFKLTVAGQPQHYKKESNREVLSTLEKMIFDYGN